jgi:hypothetical protein
MENALALPLVLTLHALLAPRAPEPGRRTLTCGYQLRLPDGPAVANEDPLLNAFGSSVVELISARDCEEALQHEAFAPGSRITLVQEGVDEDGDAVVGVWDAEVVRRAGVLPYLTAAVVAAALEQGLAVEAVVLTEDRVLLDDRRTDLQLLIHAPALLRVDLDGVEAIERPRRRARDRVVLLADGSTELCWWDPSGRGGPMDVADLPVSAELAADLERLSAAYARAAGEEEVPSDPTDGLERDWYRSSLDARARELWQRARAELGQRYAIGLLGPGMSRPAWSPEEAGADDDDDIL